MKQIEGKSFKKNEKKYPKCLQKRNIPKKNKMKKKEKKNPMYKRKLNGKKKNKKKKEKECEDWENDKG